jgi:hypothetical protein
MPQRGVLSPGYTPEQIKRSKEEAQLAFYRLRSESLRNSHTTTGPGTDGQPARPQPQPAPRKRRPGLFGYLADTLDAATGQ